MDLVGDGPRQGDVVLVSLGSASAHGIRRVRPCLVVSPDDLNLHLGTCTVAAITTGGRACPFRVPCRFGRRDGHIVLDELRTVPRGRLVKRLGRIPTGTLSEVLGVLREMFAD